jgi:transcriptional regulator with XRE-family HTH domain
VLLQGNAQHPPGTNQSKEITMSEAAQKGAARKLTPAELAGVIKMFREMRQWSQEQLADVAGLSTRTVQRIETGRPSDLDTRRALARAFEAQDIDMFNKPYVIPTEEEMKAARVQFEREHMTLAAYPLTTGRQLADLVERHSMDLMTPGFEMEREADQEFAALIDYLREYRDCHDLYQQVDKLDVYDALQERIDSLSRMGVSLRYAERQIKLMTAGEAAKPWETSVLYVVAFRIGHEPDQFATPRKFKIG